MKIALLQISSSVGNINENINSLLKAAKQAAQAGAELCIAPELAICGYTPLNLLSSESFLEQCRKKMYQLAEKMVDLPPLLVGAAIANTLPIGKPALNSAVLLKAGKVFVLNSKIKLPDYDVYEDNRYFEPGTIPGRFKFKGLDFVVVIGGDLLQSLEPCHESGVGCLEVVGRSLEYGADAIINIASLPYTQHSGTVCQKELASMAKHYDTPVIWVNNIGTCDSLIFEGRSSYFSESGELLLEAKAFEQDIKIIEIQPKDKSETTVYDASVGAVPIRSFPHRTSFSDVTAARAIANFKSTTPMDNGLEIWQALKLGLKDFVNKTIPAYSSPKVIIGISGGVDSALIAALAADTFDPVDVLGITMPSSINSQETQQDARALASSLGIQFRSIPIEEPFSVFKKLIYDTGKENSGPIVGLVDPTLKVRTVENLQARVRGSILMTLSNQIGGLVLCCSNKSELAMGYCTLYGDTVGALSPIADLLKTEVYRLCNWYNFHYQDKAIPKRILDRPPSAELSPGQKDVDSLPPYPILDSILSAHLDGGLDSAAIIAKGFQPDIVNNVFQLLTAAEFKRNQMPPILRLTAHSFCSGWRRPVIASYSL